jgi:septal ring factor EnvC (AmiA/AmiB activator)
MKNYQYPLIAALGFLLLIQSCRSCTGRRQLEFEKAAHTEYVDSVRNEISGLQSDLRTAEDSIRILNTKINSLQEVKGIMQSSLDNAVSTNHSLVQTIKNNSNIK